MAKQAVSTEFEKYFAKKKASFAEAQKAENESRGAPIPVGVTGICVVKDMTATLSRSKKVPMITLSCTVESPSEYNGKSFQRTWFISESEKASEADRYEWMLNDLENAGLPRDLRENHEGLVDICDYFISSGNKLDFEIVEDQYSTNNRRANIYARPDSPGNGQASDSGSVKSPDPAPEKEEPAQEPEAKEEPQAESAPSNGGGEIVKYMSLDYELLGEGEAEGTMKIKSCSTGRIREVSEDKIKFS